MYYEKQGWTTPVRTVFRAITEFSIVFIVLFIYQRCTRMNTERIY